MISASHLLTPYLGLELLSLSLISLVALNRKVALLLKRLSNFCFGCVIGFLLYGISMIYGATGTFQIKRNR